MVAAVPLAMLLSFVAGGAAIVLPTLAGWLALPAVGLLGLMIGLIQWFASWPDANWQLQATPAMVAGMYGLIGAGVLILGYKQPKLAAATGEPPG